MRQRRLGPSTVGVRHRLGAAGLAALSVVALATQTGEALRPTTTTTDTVPVDTVPPVPATPPPRVQTEGAAITPGGEGLPIPLPFPLAGVREQVVQLGEIEIPVLKVKQNLYEGVSLPILDRGPGHMPGSAMPGQVGNAVIGGHRTSHAKPFRNMDKLKAGDAVIFTVGKQRFTYLVESIEIVKPTDTWVVEQTWNYRATLFACHPVGSTRERIIAHLRMST